MLPIIQDSKGSSQLVEATVVSHFRRWFQTYYIHAEGEVDIAYIDQQKFWPIEVKWTQQLHAKDLKQVLKYKQGRIWSHAKEAHTLQHITTESLPWALFLMDEGLKS